MDFLSEHIRSFLPKEQFVPSQGSPIDNISATVGPLVGENEIKQYGIICFSKDRPCQLHMLLHSFQWLDEMPSSIYVIYCTSLQYQPHYEAVFKNYNVTPILQDCFEEDMTRCVDTMHHQNINYIMMAVDDMLFYATAPIKSALDALEDSSDALSVHLKLHPGITYSHPSSSACTPPVLVPYHSLLHFCYPSRCGDWSYRADLCGSIYRTSHIKTLLVAAIAAASPSVTNPNTLEVALNNALSRSSLHGLRFAFAVSSPCLSVVTVNRVQATYEVPIYESEISLEALNSKLCGDGEINLQQCLPDYISYCSNIYSSVHIPDLFISGDVATAPLVSVLLPIHNGAQYMHACLDSILRQEHVIVEVIIVLNGCTDDSSQIAAEYSSKYDRIIVIELPVADLITALDAGLQRCSFDLVARMDVDDVMLPNRCHVQSSVLHRHPEINVVGGQAIVTCDQHREVAAGIPCDAVAVQWEMMFRCCLLHPTVMFRKPVILECGGYSNFGAISSTACTIEDYSLWQRVLDRHPFSIVNVASVVLHLRRHSSSKSAREAHVALHQRVTQSVARLKSLVPHAHAPHIAYVLLLQPRNHIDELQDNIVSALKLLLLIYNTFTSKLNDTFAKALVIERRNTAAHRLLKLYKGSRQEIQEYCTLFGYSFQFDISSLVLGAASI